MGSDYSLVIQHAIFPLNSWNYWRKLIIFPGQRWT